MTINNFLLMLAALLPAVVLCVYVFQKDRVEKEPLRLLMRLLLLGTLCCFPAAYVERFIFSILKWLFSGSIYTDAQGVEYIAKNIFYKYHFIKYFFGVALVEEGFKWLALLYATKHNEEFNSLFDGLIYAVFVSIGFAAYENVGYVLQYGWMNAVMRGVLAVPGHMFFAVLMGYHYSFWHVYEKAGVLEEQLKAEGIVRSSTSIQGKGYMILSLLMPILAHGMYDFCCTLSSAIGVLVFYVFIAGLYIYCFRKIKAMSAADSSDDRYVAAILLRKYPFLSVGEHQDSNVNESI